MRRDGYLQIGDVAKQVELSLRTVRFYEEQGIITPVGRSEGGFRLYTDEHVARLMVVRRMKPLGFSVTEMQQLLSAVDDAQTEPSAENFARLDHWSQTLAAKCDKLEDAATAGRRLIAELAAPSRSATDSGGS